MPSSSTRRLADGRHWLDPLCAWLAFGVPLGITLVRAATSTQWRDDLAIVKSLGFVPIGIEGGLSTLATQLLSLVPLGGRLFRAASVSALGLAAASFVIYRMTRRTLHENVTSVHLTPLLALGAALSAALSAAWQTEGTIAGGATLGAALTLATIWLASSIEADARTWLGLGALGAAAAQESHGAALALTLALGAVLGARAKLPRSRNLFLLTLGAVTVLGFFLSPRLLRPLGGSPTADFATAISMAPSAPAIGLMRDAGALGAWVANIGMISAAGAGVSALWGLGRQKLRAHVAPLLVFCALDLVLDARPHDAVTPDPLAVLHSLASASVPMLIALGVQTCVLALSRAEIPFARPASRALVAFQFTLVLMTCEDASFLADRRSQHGAEVWTDEALSNLPAQSALLVRSPALALRLWAARAVRGERPDVLVVPLSSLERGVARAELVTEEPALAPLVRDMSISGKPSEFALSTLADARPLHVQFDATWDPRLFDHFVPRPEWLGFAAHALGRSDRAEGIHRSLRSFERVLGFAKRPEYTDEATLQMLSSCIAEQAWVLTSLGDRDAAKELLSRLRTAAPDHPLLAPIERRLNGEKRSKLDLASAALFPR